MSHVQHLQLGVRNVVCQIVAMGQGKQRVVAPMDYQCRCCYAKYKFQPVGRGSHRQRVVKACAEAG